MSAALLARMNLCALSTELPYTFFVAMNYRVHVYILDTVRSPFRSPVKTLASPNAAATGGGSESPFAINAIKVGRMLDKEILVTVSENGEICIWKTDSLDEAPLVLSNDDATWGIAIHSEQGLLAVSANNWRITIFNLLEITKTNPIYGKRKKKEPNFLGSTEKIELEGHEYNIPNVDFNESGQYIASSSVDSTCRIWDIKTQRVVTQKRMSTNNQNHDLYCWSVRFVKPGFFKHSICRDKTVSKQFLQRLYQGRSTSLSSLCLCHSAANPVFPASVSRVIELDEEDIDFDSYDGGSGETDNDIQDDLSIEQDFMEEIFERQRREDEYIYNHGHEYNGSEPEDEIQVTREEPDVSIADWTNISTNSVDQSNMDGWGDEVITGTRNHSFVDSINAEGGHIIAGSEQELFSDENTERLRQFLLSRLALHENNEESLVSSDSIDSEWASSVVNKNMKIKNQEEHSKEPKTPIVEPLSSHYIPNVARYMNDSTAHISADEDERSKGIGEYLLVTTGKNVMLMNTACPRMTKIRVENSIISKADVRSDHLLSLLDRINMVEWLPGLEVFLIASQKGTVALVRAIQIEFENGQQTFVFNNECYMPIDVLQTTPLYGMAVRKVETERFNPVSYQIFLFYYSGNILSYSISRKDSNILVDDIFL